MPRPPNQCIQVSPPSKHSITGTHIFVVVASHPKVNGSLLPASVISVYCTYLCYSGISSEPRDYECNGLHGHVKAVSTSALLLGMFTTVLSVVYSAVRAGSSTALLSPPSSPRAGSGKPLLSFDEIEEGHKNAQKDEERPVTYLYSFFHVTNRYAQEKQTVDELLKIASTVAAVIQTSP